MKVFRYLKNMKVLLSVVLVFSWLVFSLGGYLYYSMVQKETALKNTQVTELEGKLTQIGELVTAYAVASDVKMGREILDTDLVPIQVPISMANNLILDSAELVGKHYRMDMTAGTALNLDSVFEEELTDDMRLFDVVLHNVPVGLKEGAYVDVRITLPMGEDFIAIPHKKVHSIHAGVVKLSVNEQDIHVYNSMLIDSLVYPGTQIYAIEYIEGGVQQAADSYYPISKNVLAVAQKDPNLLSAIKSDIITRRDNLEQGLTGVNQGDESTREDLDIVLTRGREQYSELITEAEREFLRQEEIRKEQEYQESLGNGG